MKENYLISILGRQNMDGETGEVQVTTLGSYVKKGNNRYITYKEYDSEENGKPVTSVLKVEGNNKVTLMRGADSTRLVLENGKRHLCQYDTGYGNMMIGIFTSQLHAHLTDEGGELEVRYTLDINSNLSSSNEILITIKEAEKKDVETRAAGDQ